MGKQKNIDITEQAKTEVPTASAASTRSLADAIARAKAGEFKEYWLQKYIQENYRRLGFQELEGPFETGVDFTGIYKHKRVRVEAERRVENFVYQRDAPSHQNVDILIVLNDDQDRNVLGMAPKQWKKLLPKKIIKVDPEDFVKSTHEMRKAYALQREKEVQMLQGQGEALAKQVELALAEEAKSVEAVSVLFRLASSGGEIKHLPLLKIAPTLLRLSAFMGAFTNLWVVLNDEVPSEDTLEWEAFTEARSETALEYVRLYGINLKQLCKPGIFTRIEVLANDLIQSHRDFNELTPEEKEFAEYWLDILRENYGQRL